MILHSYSPEPVYFFGAGLCPCRPYPLSVLIRMQFFPQLRAHDALRTL
jgi:hypothetical protein